MVEPFTSAVSSSVVVSNGFVVSPLGLVICRSVFYRAGADKGAFRRGVLYTYFIVCPHENGAGI